ncbi:MAG: hypothetical protein AAGE96_10865 [Cyanobacteria bacterium P01_G01_bin.19]
MPLEDEDRYYANSDSESGDRWISIEIYTQSTNPQLLEGLERWLELGLISDLQVLKICRQNLSCALPEPQKTFISAKEEVKAEIAVAPEKELVKAAASPNIISLVWQGFLDELSIRWLLFLGIFLVIVSSGVLAASQWNNFPVFGQYLILLIYTIGFWGIGYWSSKQNNLKLTSRTLNAISILLVPINCWAISHFGLGNSILEWIALIVSLVVLSFVSHTAFKASKINSKNIFVPLFILLSFLHLTWSFIPAISLAIYGGIIILSLVNYLFLLPQPKYPIFGLLFLLSAWFLLLTRAAITESDAMLNYALAIAIFGWLLASIYLSKEKQIDKISTDKQSDVDRLTNIFLSKILQAISIIVFVVTWSVSVLGGVFESSLFFWQTVGISLLAIHLLSQRITLYWRKRDLTAVFLIGLQTVFVSKELIPDNIRSSALDLAVTVSKTEYLPESVFCVTLFPYVILFILVASWLYRQQKSELAQYAETLTLLLAIALTCLSLSNPTWRSLNLLLSTLTLSYVAYIRQPLRVPLVYFAHLLGLITILNFIDVTILNLSQPLWGCILVLLMAMEWLLFSRYQNRRRLRRQASQPQAIANKSKHLFSLHFFKSCWYAGLFFAANSYICFSSAIANTNSSALITYGWGILWLIAPIALTLIARSTKSIYRRRLATNLSCAGLILVQILSLGHPLTRLATLTAAIGLMYFNAFKLRRTWVTGIHLGFGLSLLVSLSSSFIRNDNWLIVGALLILGLYQFRLFLKDMADAPKFDYISQRTAYGILGVGMEAKNYKLIDLYIKAADYWAIALIAIEIIILSLAYATIGDFIGYLQYLLATGLILGGVIWRYQKQPNNLILYTSAWLIELLTVGIVALLGGENLSLAIANIILGLVAWISSPQIAKRKSSWAKLNLSYLPLIYTALAIFWRLSIFNLYTGLVTLSAAFILLNTAQSDRQINRVCNYLGFLAISLGVYEIVIYKMQQSSGGSAADGLTILALVAAAIAFCYRIGAWWYRQRQHQTIFNLNLSKVILIAHLHWAISSILKIIAASIAIESTTPRLTPISLATSFCLGAYAVVQGKDKDLDSQTNSHLKNDWWVYVGLVEIVATLVYSRLIISRLSFFDPWRVIFTCGIALLIYQIPWRNFGWRATPWQRAALITPTLMALVTAEDISYLSLLFTAVFYLRIAYAQKNLRWSYISLGFINWGIIRLVWQFNTEFIWLAGVVSLSILYIAQFDPYFVSQRQRRHFLRIVGCSILCVAACFYQDPGIIPGVISLCLIFLGLGFRIRALLFSGTITLVLTVIYQSISLIVAYAFLKWVVGLFTGICSIAIAAQFEKNRDLFQDKISSYNQNLRDWE